MPGAVKMVVVKGLGQMPKSFDVKYDGANFNHIGDGRHPATNCHNESWTVVSCDRDDTFLDEFRMVGRRIGNGYEVEVFIDSESPVKLWDGGRVVFRYNEDYGRWDMKGYVGSAFRGPREWYFFCPNAVVERIAAGFKCFAGENNGYLAKTADVLAGSLFSHASQIAEHARRYIPLKESGDADPVPSSDLPFFPLRRKHFPDVCEQNGTGMKTAKARKNKVPVPSTTELQRKRVPVYSSKSAP